MPIFFSCTKTLDFEANDDSLECIHEKRSTRIHVLDLLTGAPKIDIFLRKIAFLVDPDSSGWDGSDGLCGHCRCSELFPGGLRHEKTF